MSSFGYDDISSWEKKFLSSYWIFSEDSNFVVVWLSIWYSDGRLDIISQIMFAALQSLLTQSDPLYTLYVIHYTEFQTDRKCWLLALLHLGQAGKIFYPGFVLMDFCVKCLKYQDEEILFLFFFLPTFCSLTWDSRRWQETGSILSLQASVLTSQASTSLLLLSTSSWET